MIEPNFEMRKNILKNSLLLESLISSFLCQLLGIKIQEESISFGNKSTALSFNQKINLLIDIGALPKKEKSKYFMFMSIRNQFMHNININSYEDCIGVLDGSERFLLNNYMPDAKLSKEEQLKTCVLSLIADLHKLTNVIFNSVWKKAYDDAHYDVQQRSYKALDQALEGAKVKFDEYFKKASETNATIETKSIKTIGSDFIRTMNILWKKEFDSLSEGGKDISNK